jgi:uncharacterized protein (DUF305 family)
MVFGLRVREAQGVLILSHGAGEHKIDTAIHGMIFRRLRMPTGPRTPARRRFLLLGLAVLGVVATGCSGAETSGADAAAPAAAQPRVLQPGRPGEPAATLAPGATVAQPPYNAADVAFVQRMIPHHAQALRMCALAETRASNDRVRALARRIAGAQGPEVMGLSAWLQSFGLPYTDAAAHGDSAHRHARHSGTAASRMPGMLSRQDMRRLAAAHGNRFDRLFLAAMVRHHRGAVTMAQHALTHGSDIRANEIASDVAAEQTAEIDRLRDLRRRL